MSRFLNYLNISIDSNTPMDIIQGGQIIDGLQAIYEDIPEGVRKDNFASMIGETASILIKRINEMSSVTTPQATRELEEIERQREQNEANQITQELENRPNPAQDTSLDDVDPPIDRGGNPPTDEDNTTNTELQDLINTIHNLKF